jgi:hypothetical protein
MGVEIESECRQISQCLASAQVRQLTREIQPSHNLANLHFDQVRRVPGLSFICEARMDISRPSATEQEFDYNRCVEDYQWRSLSSRRAPTIVERVATGRNFASRDRICMGVGR